MGIEVSRRYLAAADLVLLCVEADARSVPDEAALAVPTGRTLLVRTKGDLGDAERPRALAVSVVTGEGSTTLRRAVAERVFGDRIALGDLEPTLASERHREALRARGRRVGGRAPNTSSPAATRSWSSHHVREATLALDELVGVGGCGGGAGEGVRRVLRGEVSLVSLSEVKGRRAGMAPFAPLTVTRAGLRRLHPPGPVLRRLELSAEARSASASPRWATSASVMR